MLWYVVLEYIQKTLEHCSSWFSKILNSSMSIPNAHSSSLRRFELRMQSTRALHCQQCLQLLLDPKIAFRIDTMRIDAFCDVLCTADFMGKKLVRWSIPKVLMIKITFEKTVQ